ncbi:MAG: 2-oxoacid:ferredoxin oxidoreductase subunit beta, partial [Candidatus Binatia bacterium]
MHDGSVIRLHKLEKDWDPLDRISAMNAVQTARTKGEILTGLLYINPDHPKLHVLLETSEKPLNSLTQNELCPGSAALDGINSGLR